MISDSMSLRALLIQKEIKHAYTDKNTVESLRALLIQKEIKLLDL